MKKLTILTILGLTVIGGYGVISQRLSAATKEEPKTANKQVEYEIVETDSPNELAPVVMRAEGSV